MTAAIPFLLLLGQGTQTTPSLEFIGSGLRAQVAGKAIFISHLDPTKADPEVAAFRKGDVWVVWDERGLTLRNAKRFKSTRLPEVPVSAKLFDAGEIASNRARIRKGEISGHAGALSGAKRLGDEVYLLLRWNDRKGSAWLEALVHVSLAPNSGQSAKTFLPTPTLVGRFDLPSIAKGKFDKELLVFPNPIAPVSNGSEPPPSSELLGSIVKGPAGWGIGTFDPASRQFSTIMVGAKLSAFVHLGSRLGIFTESTDWGTSLVGRVDMMSGARRDLFETRGRVSLIDHESPLLVRIDRPGQAWLRNSESGAEVRVPVASGIRRTELGLLVWSPAANPTMATLYDPSRWSVVARWEKPKSEPKPPQSRSGGRRRSGG